MKKIRAIGYKQTFDINKYGLFGKLLNCEPAWVIRSVHYFYVDQDADADEIYRSRYSVREDEDVQSGWVDWYSTSGNVDVLATTQYKHVTSEVVEIELNSTPTIKTLMEDMEAEQFKEWFYSNIKI